MKHTPNLTLAYVTSGPVYQRNTSLADNTHGNSEQKNVIWTKASAHMHFSQGFFIHYVSGVL